MSCLGSQGDIRELLRGFRGFFLVSGLLQGVLRGFMGISKAFQGVSADFQRITGGYKKFYGRFRGFQRVSETENVGRY